MPMKMAITTPKSETAVRPRFTTETLDIDRDFTHQDGRPREQ